MDDIQLKLNDAMHGAFVLEKDGERFAEMEIAIKNGELTIFHTEVSEALKGQGIASRLLASMVSYAREKQLKVIPLCPFVHGQFQRRPDQYADIWKKAPVK